MENTQDNFEAFVAQYWGQKVLSSKDFEQGDCITVAYHNRLFRELSFTGEYFLLLRDLSDLSQKELKVLGSMLGLNKDFFLCLNNLISSEVSSQLHSCLISMGVAFEWRGLSVSEQVKRG